MKLPKHDNALSKMLTKMQNIYCMLKENGHKPDSYCGYLYTLFKTGPNADFDLFINCTMDGIQLDCGLNHNITCHELIIATWTKCHNMVEVSHGESWLFTKLKILEKEAVKTNAAEDATNGHPPKDKLKMNPIKE